MLVFLQQNLATILGATLVFGAVAAICISGYKKRKTGGCGSGCSGCANRGNCHPH